MIRRSHFGDLALGRGAFGFRHGIRELLSGITVYRNGNLEHCTRSSRVKNTTVTRKLRSVSRKGARSKEPEIVDLDKEESISEPVARPFALQAGARGSSSPDGRKPPIRQSPRLSGRSDRSTASDIRSGSPPTSKPKTLSFAGAAMSPALEEKKARERVDAKKRRNKEPEEGKEEKKNEAFVIRQSFDNIGRELISLASTTLQEMGKQDIEAPTKADNDMLLPLAQKMSKVIAVKRRQCEQNSLEDRVMPMALIWRGRNHWSAT